MPKTTKKAPAKKAVKPKVVKKAAPKKVVKKAVKKTAKKAAPKKSAKRELVYAPDNQSFWTTDGQVLNSLVALRDALEAMEKDVYLYHAGKEHNDFANWVDNVLCDADCAKALEKAKNPKSAKTVVVRHLKVYAL